jgi:alkylation response protein AidB-like acyl-CoA dehydrogenase
VVVIEELARAGTTGPGFFIHSEMAAPYLVNFGTEEQKAKWLPRLATGEVVAAIAMSEPDAGSDLRAMRSLATRTDSGWRLNGQKVFISNGQQAGLVIVAAKVDKDDKNSVTLFLVDTTKPGFRRGRNLEKLGVHAQDTSELFFDDVELSDDDVLGGPGQGFRMLMHGLVRERLSICIACQMKAETALESTIEYTTQRKLFGQHLSDMQNTRFKLAEMKTEVTVGRTFIDSMLGRYLEGTLNDVDAAMGKLWITEMLGRVLDQCLQLHGGWGYMREYPISRAYADARIERIAGGSSEVMKEIIGRAIVGKR